METFTLGPYEIEAEDEIVARKKLAAALSGEIDAVRARQRVKKLREELAEAEAASGEEG